MKRRELLKNIGLLSITGASVALMASCQTKGQDEKIAETVKEPEKTEREKLIINRTKMSIQNPDNPNELELKHTPFIEVKEQDDKGFTKISITIGSKGIIHPTENNHWIDYYKLFLDDKLIATTEVEIGAARGYNSFFVKLDGVKTIRVEIGCNLHGIWENTLTLA
ncbi:MAG: twin-arginine translocation pathway signal protein [Chloroflexia bacterium]|nr:twin-arginine translocation pathway signal protein [Chloroflexia bacterium]